MTEEIIDSNNMSKNVSETEKITEENFVPYSTFIKIFLLKEEVEFEDFRTMMPEEFKEKYGVEKSAVNDKAVNTYKTEYSKHYEYERELYEKVKQKRREEYMKKQQEYINRKKEAMIDILLNQTNYTRDVIIEKLEQHKYDLKSIIREYLGGTREKDEKEENKSVNQRIYTEIRSYMDSVSEGFEKRREQTAKINEYLVKKQQEAEEKDKQD